MGLYDDLTPGKTSAAAAPKSSGVSYSDLLPGKPAAAQGSTSVPPPLQAPGGANYSMYADIIPAPKAAPPAAAPAEQHPFMATIKSFFTPPQGLVMGKTGIADVAPPAPTFPQQVAGDVYNAITAPATKPAAISPENYLRSIYGTKQGGTIKGGIVGDTIDAWGNFIQKMNAAGKAADTKAPAIDRVVATGEAGLAAINAFFTPVTTVFQEAATVPGPVGKIADLVNKGFGALGAAGADTFGAGLQASPFLTPEQKTKLLPLAQQIGALAAQIAAGKVGEDGLGKMKEATGKFVSTVLADPRFAQLTALPAFRQAVAEKAVPKPTPTTEIYKDLVPAPTESTPHPTETTPTETTPKPEDLQSQIADAHKAVQETYASVARPETKAVEPGSINVPEDLQPVAKAALEYKTPEEFATAVHNAEFDNGKFAGEDAGKVLAELDKLGGPEKFHESVAPQSGEKTAPVSRAEEEFQKMRAQMLDLSERGYRYQTGLGVDEQMHGVKSTFPDFISEGKLKSKALFQKVVEPYKSIADLKYPENPRAVKQRALVHDMFDQLDKQLGVDTSAHRARIVDTYERLAETKPGRGKTSSTDGGGGRGAGTDGKGKQRERVKQFEEGEVSADTEEKANEDWADHHAEKFGELSSELSTLEKQIEDTKRGPEKDKLTAKAAAIGDEMARMEQAHIDKWFTKKSAVTDGKTVFLDKKTYKVEDVLESKTGNNKYHLVGEGKDFWTNNEGMKDAIVRPETPEEVASSYWDAKIQPSIDAGETVVIDPDAIRSHFGDYALENRMKYSKGGQLIIDRALKDVPYERFISVGGGPGSGKSEIFTNSFKDENIKAIVYDSSMSDAKYVNKLIDKVEAAGKTFEANLVIANPADARWFTLARQAVTGREVSHDFFVNAHAGYPETILAMVKRGVDVYVFDMRGKTLEEAKATIEDGKYVEDIVDLISKMDYNKETIRASARTAEEKYATENTHKQQEKTRQKAPQENRGEHGEAPRRGGKNEGGTLNSNTLETNDKVLLTEKSTGRTQVRYVKISPENGLLLRDPASWIPKKVDLSKFDLTLLEKDSPDVPKPGIGINSPEMIAQEKADAAAKGGTSLGFNPKELAEPHSAAAAGEVDKIIKRKEIADNFLEKIGVQLRYGKFRQQALGIYKTKEQLIRHKAGSLNTIFHEAGHFLDLGRELGISDFVKKYPDEKEYLLREYAKPPADPKRARWEAAAELIRIYMLKRFDYLEKGAPETLKHFRTVLDAYPEVRDAMHTAMDDYERWQQMPAAAKVLSQLSLEDTGGKLNLDKLVGTTHALYTQALDQLHPLSEFSTLAKDVLGEGNVTPEKDPYILARNLRGWVGKADTFLRRGTIDKNYYDVKNGKISVTYRGKSFEDITRPLDEKGALNDFRTYLAAHRALELADRSIKTGISRDDASTAVKELDAKHPELAQARKDLYKYQDDVLNFAKENGLISAESIDAMRVANRSYVPFYRVVEEYGSGRGAGRGVGNNRAPIKRIKGSEREIIDPLESIVKNTYAMVNAAERNAVGLAMTDLAKGAPELGQLVEPIPRNMSVTKVEVAEVLQKAGMSEQEAQAIADDVGTDIVNIFRASDFTKPGELFVMRNGKPELYEVQKDLWRAIQGLDTEDTALVVKLLSMPAALLRAGATLTPDFSVRNPLRDQFSAFVYSKGGYLPGIDLVRGMWSVFTNDASYQIWKIAGGESATLVSMDRAGVRESLSDVLKTRRQMLLDYVKNPIRILQAVSNLTEEATRVGEMRKALLRDESAVGAAFASREVTIDFARMGAKTKAANLLIAFWNANLQGSDRMIRAFKDNPGRTAWRVALSITLPSVLLYYANRKDPRYKEIPQWQKDLFWIVMTDKHIYRIPKPFELGVLFGSVPERVLEAIDNQDPTMIGNLEKSISNGASPGFIPTALIPIIENITNYSFFLDRPIVAQGKQGLPAEAQFGPATSEVSKIIGDAIGYSPAKVDNLIHGYTGGLGIYTTNVIDKLLEGTGVVQKEPGPTKTLEQTPILKAFMVPNPEGANSESVNRFYDLYAHAQADYQYVNALVKSNQVDDAKAYVAKHPDTTVAPQLQQIANTLAELRKAGDAIRNSHELSPEEKTARLEKVDELITKTAQEALHLGKNP